MNQIFAFLVAAAVRATILLVVTAGVAALLRKRAAAVQHALWSAAIAALLSFPLLSPILPGLGVRNPYSVSRFAFATWERIVGPPRVQAPNGGSETSAAAKRNASAQRTLFDIRQIFTSVPSGNSTAAEIREVLLLVWFAGFLLGVLSDSSLKHCRHSVA